MQSIDPQDVGLASTYKLLVGSVVPRPIAWVSSRSAAGIANIAPFSFFTVASTDPPMLCFSIGRSDRTGCTTKDTLRCIRETRGFVVNIAPAHLVHEVAATAVEYDDDVDEFSVAGLTMASTDLVDAPRIADSPVSIECELDREVVLGDDVLVIGRVLRFHFRDDVVDESFHVCFESLQPLGRLGGPHFSTEMNRIRVDVPEAPR